MSRAFAPLDVVRLRALSRGAVSLDLEGDVLLRRSPLARALIGLLGAGPDITLMLVAGETGSPPGFVQARQRAGGAAADLVRIAPDLEDHGAALAWQRLLSDACQRLGARGTRRVYAVVPLGDDVALHILQRVGFAAFSADTVYRRDADVGPPVGVAPPDPTTVQAAARLAEADRAARERMIEGPESDWSTYPVGGHWPGRVASGALLTKLGEARGAWRVIDGVAGSWLRAVAVDDDAGRETVAAALAAAGRGPVWAAARAHQAGLHAALRHHGFQPVGDRCLLVKHTTRNVLAPAWHEHAAGAIMPSPPVTPARSRSTGA